MKERGIIMTGVSVRAILDGMKTQTRRIAKPRFDDRTPCKHWKGDGDIMMRHCEHGSEGMPCPMGVVGERLWVKETHQIATGKRKDDLAACVRYRDTTMKAATMVGKILPLGMTFDRWRPSRFMPRWASRITLEITQVSTQRLQDISDQDAIAEGCESVPMRDSGQAWRFGESGPVWTTARGAYCALWKTLHGPGSWESNPWVWVLSFRRIET